MGLCSQCLTIARALGEGGCLVFLGLASEKNSPQKGGVQLLKVHLQDTTLLSSFTMLISHREVWEPSEDCFPLLPQMLLSEFSELSLCFFSWLFHPTVYFLRHECLVLVWIVNHMFDSLSPAGPSQPHALRHPPTHHVLLRDTWATAGALSSQSQQGLPKHHSLWDRKKEILAQATSFSPQLYDCFPPFLWVRDDQRCSSNSSALLRFFCFWRRRHQPQISNVLVLNIIWRKAHRVHRIYISYGLEKAFWVYWCRKGMGNTRNFWRQELRWTRAEMVWEH